MKLCKKSMLCVAVVLFLISNGLADTVVFGSGSSEISMEFVNIDNAGFSADPLTGYGFVDYTYAIGKYEVTSDQMNASGLGVGSYWNSNFDPRDIGPQAPAVTLSWHHAAQYCNWLTSGSLDNGAYTIGSDGYVSAIDRASAVNTFGKVYVIPTENEWYKAAYFTGSGYSLYANGTGTPPVQIDDTNYGEQATPWAVGSGAVEQNDTFDMMGNVWEWTEDANDGYYDRYIEKMVVRGSAYYYPETEKISSEYRSSHGANQYSHRGVGFRVAMIPEPSSIAVMVMSVLGLTFIRARFYI